MPPRHEKNGDETVRKPKKRTLFFRNLSDTTEEEDLMEIFSKKLPDVKIVDVRIIRDEQGVKRGIGFVDVETQEMAEQALKLNNTHLKGNSIKVDLSKPPSEG
jgi:RNA recognition motif-containing protein